METGCSGAKGHQGALTKSQAGDGRKNENFRTFPFDKMPI